MTDDTTHKGSSAPDPLQTDVGRPESVDENAAASAPDMPDNPGDIKGSAQAQ